MKVFAVEDTTAQVTWRRLPGGAVLRAAGAAVAVRGGPGAVVLEGLPPATDLDLVLEPTGGRARRVGRFRTLAPPPGRELARVATVNDCHLGGEGFGLLPRAHHPDGRFALDTHERCLRAAVAEAVAWGAQLLVVKGDLTDSGQHRQWQTAARVLGGAGVPVAVVPGNHDVMVGSSDGHAVLAGAGVRLTVGDAEAYDLPGLRVVATDSTRPRSHRGTMERLSERVLGLAGDAPGPVMVAMHHQLEPFALRTHYPPGIPGREGAPFLDSLAAVNPAALVAAGHTHRHRRRRHGPVLLTELGSSKDFPGTWAGYAVHEGGIRQVVRRVADPAVLGWTDATRRCYLGLWGPWSTWTLDARCFSHTWPARPSVTVAAGAGTRSWGSGPSRPGGRRRPPGGRPPGR